MKAPSLLTVVIDDAHLDVLAHILAWVVDIDDLDCAFTMASISATTTANAFRVRIPGVRIAIRSKEAVRVEFTSVTSWPMRAGGNFGGDFELLGEFSTFEGERSQVETLGLFLRTLLIVFEWLSLSAMNTFEFNERTDQIATILNHLNAVYQLAVMVEALVDQVLNMKVTHIRAMGVH